MELGVFGAKDMDIVCRLMNTRNKSKQEQASNNIQQQISTTNVQEQQCTNVREFSFEREQIDRLGVFVTDVITLLLERTCRFYSDESVVAKTFFRPRPECLGRQVAGEPWPD